MATSARRRRKRPTPRGLIPAETLPAAGDVPAAPRALAARVAADGGAALAVYREPLAGGWCVLAALPIEKVAPTPFQRELSPAHAKRLAAVIAKLDRFLDPLIAVAHGEGYWTPNGMHRLAAMRALGARTVVALLLPEPEIALKILALNTEKAHTLRDKSLEALRMARTLAADPATARRPEEAWAFEFEEPAYLTLGLCYEENGRFSGGAYLPVVRRCEAFSSGPIAASLEARARRAVLLATLDAAVTDCVKRLKAAGFASGYLKPFVVARINPLRFQRQARPGQKAPRGVFEKTVEAMIAAARSFDPRRIRPQDVAALAASGPAAEE